MDHSRQGEKRIIIPSRHSPPQAHQWILYHFIDPVTGRGGRFPHRLSNASAGTMLLGPWPPPNIWREIETLTNELYAEMNWKWFAIRRPIILTLPAIEDLPPTHRSARGMLESPRSCLNTFYLGRRFSQSGLAGADSYYAMKTYEFSGETFILWYPGFALNGRTLSSTFETCRTNWAATGSIIPATLVWPPDNTRSQYSSYQILG